VLKWNLKKWNNGGIKMDFNQYQELAARTLNTEKSLELTLVNMSMGLVGESGETVDYMKKVLFQGHEFNVERLASELGDVLWYVAGMCTALNIDMKEVAQYNIEKLVKRYPEGFKTEDSVNRVEENEENV
jgi:NTP pyrophosphatase (non-canonical NTP hydrolase)